jgi:aminoglycoside phosphotransferase (APT) family kinase protein
MQRMIETRTEQVRQLAEELLGPVETIVHQQYGHSGLTFDVRAGSEYILKTRTEKGSFDHTEHHIGVLSALGAPVPAVLKRGEAYGFEYVVLAKIPGQDLGYELAGMTKAEMSALAAEIVGIERKVATLPKGRGFGWTPLEVPGPFASWTAVVERDSRTCPPTIRNEVLRCTGVFEAVEPVCFLDDLTVKNVIVQDGKLQGIVDLDFFCFGDPLYWLSLTEVTAMLDVGPAASFYGEELRRLWGMDEVSSAMCDLYNAIQSWFFLGKGSGHEELREWSEARFRRARLFTRDL